ncbi:hypothetical protein ACX80Z_06555 [Arthrobacter sp. TMT4-20]
MSRRGYQWAAGASLGVALLLAGCGAPELESETAAAFQASVRDIATAAAAGDQAGATQLALDLSQAVTVAQGQGTVSSDRAAQITSTIDELLLAITAEVGPADPANPAAPTAPAAPVPEPTTNTPSPLPETPAETPVPPVSPPSGGDDEEENGDDAGSEDDKAQREAERELEKQQREQEKLEKEAEREQGQPEDDG